MLLTVICPTMTSWLEWNEEVDTGTGRQWRDGRINKTSCTDGTGMRDLFPVPLFLKQGEKMEVGYGGDISKESRK